MKIAYIAPEAQLMCFRPVEELALIQWEDLFNGQFGEEAGRNPAVQESSDINIKI